MSDARPRVALANCPDYSPANVERAVGQVLELLGGMRRFVRPGQGVFLKANMLSAKRPEDAVTTHPEVVRAVARAALEAGGKPAVGDSSGFGALSAVGAKTGIAAVADELDIPLEELTEPIETERPTGARFRRLRLARRVLDADVVINLPKVKTHQQMFLTLAVKNLFGCIVGKEKIAWHMSAGRDTMLFARALVEICAAIKPALSIADGVVGMEGSGPSHGDTRAFGFIAAGTDPFALDTVLTWLLGFEPDELPVLAAAREARDDGLDVGVTDLNSIDIVGYDAEKLRVHDLKRPATARVMFLPDFLSRIARPFITVKPRIDASKCRVCGICVDSCPAHALKIVDRRVKIDDTSCIRCFCCEELCPQGAVWVKRGLLSRFFSK